MREIITGISLMYLIPSSIYFWKFIIEHDKKEDDVIEKRWEDCD